jgi:nicotinamide-nucleotide amidase
MLEMRCEIVAVGTELLLGQIVDTNSSWMGERLALIGVEHLRQTKVGDNLGRIVDALTGALERADAVVVCGGLGPTQDDITREAIAQVMQVELVRDDKVADVIRELFASRGRTMPDNNLRQADVPVGATVIEQRTGTAPGLICPVGDKVIYAVPGVPYEMTEMMERAVLPDLATRAGVQQVIVSRVLRTWGESESQIAELLDPRLRVLDETGSATIAFLASGIEGIKVRLTARGDSEEHAKELLDAEEAEVRAALGDIVFSTDDLPMEAEVGRLLDARGWTLAIAESLTGGLAASRVVNVPGSSEWFKGGVVAYDSQVKFDVLDVPEGPVVSEAAAKAMADGVRRLLRADVGLSTTGVAGPAEQERQPPGTVWLGVAVGAEVEARQLRLPGTRDRVRQLSVISLMDLLRRKLLAGS